MAMSLLKDIFRYELAYYSFVAEWTLNSKSQHCKNFNAGKADWRGLVQLPYKGRGWRHPHQERNRWRVSRMWRYWRIFKQNNVC